jgi:hypothetical protein
MLRSRSCRSMAERYKRRWRTVSLAVSPSTRDDCRVRDSAPRLPQVQVGREPGLRPVQSYVAAGCSASNIIQSFRIDQTTGELTEVTGSPFGTASTPPVKSHVLFIELSLWLRPSAAKLRHSALRGPSGQRRAIVPRFLAGQRGHVHRLSRCRDDQQKAHQPRMAHAIVL